MSQKIKLFYIKETECESLKKNPLNYLMLNSFCYAAMHHLPILCSHTITLSIVASSDHYYKEKFNFLNSFNK